MKILIIGTGGRETAISKKLRDSEIYFIKTCKNDSLSNVLEVKIENFPSIAEKIKELSISHVIIGPEYPLSLGIVDYLKSQFPPYEENHIRIFGPTQYQSRLETDKHWCRELVNRVEPTMNPNYMLIETLNDLYFAFKDLHCIRMENEIRYNSVVFKPIGLTSGKGVRIFNSINEIVFEEMKNYLLSEKKPFLLEERLEGEEFSLILFKQENVIKFFPPVQDFKRSTKNSNINTGGMGAISGYLTFLSKENLKTCKDFMKTVIETVEDDSGSLYSGFLYGSFMITEQGPKLIEFNVRLGDPEAINIASYIDYIDPEKMEISMKKVRPCITRYFVPYEYPKCIGSAFPITIPEHIESNITVANVFLSDKGLYHEKSRTFAITYTGFVDHIIPTINKACIELKDDNPWLRYRPDIGPLDLSYKDSGVDVDKNEEIVSSIKDSVSSTFNSSVLSEFGQFGGIFEISDDLKLIASVDGIGSKTSFLISAAEYVGITRSEAHRMMAVDLISHSINDIIVQGGKPLFFLDYIASSKIDPVCISEFVDSLSIECKKYGIALLGGETSEMPGIYTEGSTDIAGTIVGTLTSFDLIDGKKNIQEGDVVIALPSSGLHTNGYSLIRHMISAYGGFSNFSPDFILKLMISHRCYLLWIRKIRKLGVNIKGMCHNTGGGLTNNIPRVLPDDLEIEYTGLESHVNEGIYGIISQLCNLSQDEMLKTFNCGIGMILFIDEKDLSKMSEIPGLISLGIVRKKKKYDC